MKPFMTGIEDVVDGFKLIREPKLRLFVIIPLIINTLVFFGFIALLGHYFSGWVDGLLSWLPDWEWLAFLRWFLWVVFAFLVILLVAYAFVFVATLIGAPFYGLLAEQVERRLTGQQVSEDTPWSQVIKSIPRSVGREIAKLLYYLPRALGLFILGFIPPVNAATPFLWAIFSSWTMALEFLDYPADTHGKSIDELKTFMRQNRARTLGFGLISWGCTLVPILNLVSMQASVAGGVKFWLQAEGKLKDKA
ncbi:sulfate transporter CysZ [Hahella sp. CCB-MM4]|uniref:sulfate transporter CysZ n=1 Tax=Hahella sp. (strain CCB-MM4) TaxID=1926491 RepID=UPI000B9B8AA1|nr:sulfate transporter CysZ [Hahella sp. CCB-MM4]OZG75061.1 sulfate transporter CysZ [Hahella sp. CCB-MM4]